MKVYILTYLHEQHVQTVTLLFCLQCKITMNVIIWVFGLVRVWNNEGLYTVLCTCQSCALNTGLIVTIPASCTHDLYGVSW